MYIVDGLKQFEWLRISSFFLNFDLRIGSLIIGCIALVANISIAGSLVFGLAFVTFIDMMDNDSVVWKGRRDEKNDNLIHTMYIALPIFLVIFIINVILSARSIVGVHKSERRKLKAYLTYAPFFTLAYIGIMIFSSVVGDRAGDQICYFFILSIISYYTLVIGSYYLKLDEDKNGSPSTPL